MLELSYKYLNAELRPLRPLNREPSHSMAVPQPTEL